MRIWPADVVDALHAELDKQTAAFNEKVTPLELAPLELANDEAGDVHNSALERLISTVPTTTQGVAAVAKCVRYDPETNDFFCDGECMKDFLATIALAPDKISTAA